jgi:phytol kinase
VSEIWWRKRKPHDEFSRKFIHITVGCFVAFWPYFLTWNQIFFLSGAFIAVVLISQYLNIFKAIHAVERPTWGELCFAAAVGVLAIVTREPAIYMVAVLHMGLADGLAAVFGTIYGKSNSYMVLGHKKSVVGSLAFLLTSWLLLIGYATISSAVINPLLLVGIAGVATALENFAVHGLDNLLVPLFIAGSLALLT